METAIYLAGYSSHTIQQVQRLVDDKQLGRFLLNKYPAPHTVQTDKALYELVLDIKNTYLKQSPPISKIVYDDKIKSAAQALGLHTYVSRIQGAKLKAKHEIRIASIFKQAPFALLRAVSVHELAHLKEKDHNKAFYKLCLHMEPGYQQLELDLRLFLIYR